MNPVTEPIVLVVLDGFGLSLETRGNAIAQARKPNFDDIEKNFPFTTLQASASAVGLPLGEAGNSEVGHLTMGAGRVIYHHLPRIITSIRDGSFYQNRAFLEIADHVRKNKSALHLLGLVSSGSVHSYIDHLYALLDLTAREKVERVFLHVITDGRDAPPREGADFVSKLNDLLSAKYPHAKIASLVGRSVAMDRDEKWERIEEAYELLVTGRGVPFENPGEFLRRSYAEGASDESIPPAYAEKEGRVRGRVEENDGLILFNFREDSMREITEAFAAEGFSAFRRAKIKNLRVATMTEYEKNLAGVEAAFRPLEISWPLARVLSAAGKRQLHIAESEKYAHVTYFFNGGEERPFPEEDRILVPSSAEAGFDEHPQMKAAEITEKIVGEVGKYDFILGNLANADMVGHTGNFPAVVSAVEALDEAVGRLRAATLEKGGILIVTADHGNAEKKMNPISGEPLTEHTTNPVPFYLIGRNYKLRSERSEEEIRAVKKVTGGILTDIAPTVLELAGLEQPKEMTGQSLLPLLLRRR
ncbi:MAG: 2,3-bisphosphoglycerate-independent phosphoglycerate mutase [Candidatus Sungbacteria bacterium]|nr:2,3-bisphosphoglycerate-independent phosphoglycerate mutase [Candidatus Sungbacteria bacterium]